MTTPSGKPPFDEQPLDSRLDPSDDGPKGGPDSSREPPTQRQPTSGAAPPAGGAASGAAPLYGTVVPYGGDDRTEEIDPVALDAPFTPEQSKPLPTPIAGATPRAPAAAPRDMEMQAPAAQLMLSDLFDSVPPSSALAPPDPAAFSSSRPPPARAPSQPPAPAAGRDAIVALPSIDIGSKPHHVAPSPPLATAQPPRTGPDAPAWDAVRAPTPSPAFPEPVLPPTPPVERGEPNARRSVPTLESIGNAGPSPSGAWPRAAMPSAPPMMPSEPPPSEPLPREPLPGQALPGQALPSEPVPDARAQFPSDVATSRPPDVMLSPAPARAGRAELRPMHEVKAPLATVTAPAVSQASKAQSQLPSIMLAADVEAEPDSASRRAMRAARATVRLELPANFGRPGSPVVPGLPPATSAAPSLPLPVPAPPPGFARSRGRRWVGAALAGLLLVVALWLALSPRSGSLVVTALGPGNRAVDDVTIFIDDDPLCDVSPCRIKGLSPGAHTLRASAPNLASQEETVEISTGAEATRNLDLIAVAPEVRGGGIRIAAAEASFTLYVDGKRVGKLPQEVSGLSAGKHWIKLDPEDGSPAIEKSVDVLAGEMIDVAPTPARREKALVTIRLDRGSEGARVTFDDAFLLDFPAELELEPETVHTLSATKPGYDDLTMEVRLDAGETEKLIEVSLERTQSRAAARRSRAARQARRAAARAAPTRASAKADSTQGVLNISSNPPSQIILNGRPLGTTPKTGIEVPGDSLQTIVFVHPEMGRRRAQKFVPAGKERTVSIRF